MKWATDCLKKKSVSFRVAPTEPAYTTDLLLKQFTTENGCELEDNILKKSMRIAMARIDRGIGKHMRKAGINLSINDMIVAYGTAFAFHTYIDDADLKNSCNKVEILWMDYIRTCPDIRRVLSIDYHDELNAWLEVQFYIWADFRHAPSDTCRVLKVPPLIVRTRRGIDTFVQQNSAKETWRWRYIRVPIGVYDKYTKEIDFIEGLVNSITELLTNIKSDSDISHVTHIMRRIYRVFMRIYFRLMH